MWPKLSHMQSSDYDPHSQIFDQLGILLKLVAKEAPQRVVETIPCFIKYFKSNDFEYGSYLPIRYNITFQQLLIQFSSAICSLIKKFPLEMMEYKDQLCSD